MERACDDEDTCEYCKEAEESGDVALGCRIPPLGRIPAVFCFRNYINITYGVYGFIVKMRTLGTLLRLLLHGGGPQSHH